MIQQIAAAVFFLLIGCNQTFGQAFRSDTFLIERAKQKAQVAYQLFEGVQSRLYNGKLYRDYSIPLSEGHPYFSTDQFETGSIRYDGMFFENVPLLYNIVSDEVITPHYNKVQWVSLRNDKIESFNFGGHQFIRIEADSLNVDITSGLYEQLYAGKTMALKKKSKFVVESISNNTLIRKVKVTERHFVLHEESWYRVTSLRSVLNVLEGHNAAIRQHLRSAKIKYRRNPDLALASVAAYYDQLTAGK